MSFYTLPEGTILHATHRHKFKPHALKPMIKNFQSWHAAQKDTFVQRCPFRFRPGTQIPAVVKTQQCPSLPFRCYFACLQVASIRSCAMKKPRNYASIPLLLNTVGAACHSHANYRRLALKFSQPPAWKIYLSKRRLYTYLLKWQFYMPPKRTVFQTSHTYTPAATNSHRHAARKDTFVYRCPFKFRHRKKTDGMEQAVWAQGCTRMHARVCAHMRVRINFRMCSRKCVHL